jgi:hypothetical protein
VRISTGGRRREEGGKREGEGEGGKGERREGMRKDEEGRNLKRTSSLVGMMDLMASKVESGK